MKCLFTSGGPLAVRDGLTGAIYLKGLYSFGPQLCNSTRPFVFTNVESFVPWILNLIKTRF